MKIYAAFYERIIETKIITQFYSMKKKEHHKKKKTFIINKFSSNTAQDFFNQLMTDHSPYIDLLFTWICKIMQLLLIRKVWGDRIQESTEINNPFIAIIVYLSRQKSKWTDSA